MARSETEQTQSLANYLPTGRAWGAKNLPGSVTRALLAGFSGELVRNEALITEFRDEIIPDETVLFLQEWENALAIPDGCFSGEGTDDERRNDILMKLASLGVQTAEDIRILALRVYGLEIEITTPEIDPASVWPITWPHLWGSSDRESRFTILINYLNLPETVKWPISWPHMWGTREQGIFECLIARLKPANVAIGVTSDVPPPGPTGWFAGGRSLHFDESVPQYLDAGSGTSTRDFQIDNDFTVMAWIKNESGGTSLSRTIIALGDTSGTQNQIWFEITYVTFHRFGIKVLDAATGNQKFYYFSVTLPDDQWFQVAATWDGGTNTLTLYIDGGDDPTPVKASDQPISLVRTPMTPSIGARQSILSITNSEMHGNIHQIAIWNSVLSTAELLETYNVGVGNSFDLRANRGLYTSAANLINWYAPGLYDSPELAIDLAQTDDLIDITVEHDIDNSDIENDAPT